MAGESAGEATEVELDFDASVMSVRKDGFIRRLGVVISFHRGVEVGVFWSWAGRLHKVRFRIRNRVWLYNWRQWVILQHSSCCGTR